MDVAESNPVAGFQAQGAPPTNRRIMTPSLMKFSFGFDCRFMPVLRSNAMPSMVDEPLNVGIQ